MLRLYTFNLSHFSEKARWALDYEGISYEEKILLPGPHLLTTRRIAERSEVPILQHDGRYVQGSGAIIDYIADQLGGTKLTPAAADARAAALALEREVDQALGRGVQTVLYSVMLKPEHTGKVVDLWVDNGPAWSRAFYKLAFPFISPVVKAMYKTHKPDHVEQAKQRLLAAMDALDARLASAPYLGGERPSRADVTVAALLGPVCRPREHHVKWPEAPPELADFEAQLKERPTWAHALRMYREHRR